MNDIAHVTGLAALILAKNNTLTVAELKALILDHGDSLPTLSGKTTTGKRINAFTSISNTPAIKPPTQPPQNQDTGTGYGHTCFTNSDNKVMCWGAL